MVIDTHVHCGIQESYPSQSFEDYLGAIKGTGIRGAIMFPPIMEIYNRYDPNFEDDQEWQLRRKRANDYLLTLGNDQLVVFPYLFIWNDFAVENLTAMHRGIKIHRHADEPIYKYGDERCAAVVRQIRKRNMPVLLEEELINTLQFIKEVAIGVKVIIPHLGFFNGGYRTISRHAIWELSNIYTDTSLAPPDDIIDYVKTYGDERILFGSDFPIGDPRSELKKIIKLDIPKSMKRAIAITNTKKLLGGVTFG